MAALKQDYDIVEGSRISEVFHYLLQNNTFVKAYAGGNEIEQLLLIDEIDGNDGGLFSFKITLNDDLRKEMIQSSPSQISFEFMGPDHLPYQCEVQLKKLNWDHIWFKSPEHLRRYQLRKNFRVQAPRGIQLKVTIKKTAMVMDVINISLGGLYCHVHADYKDLVKKKKSIKSVALIFTYPGQSCEVQIQLIELRRFEDRSRTAKIGVAYEFISVRPEEKRRLTRQIYELQREHLRGRLKHI